MGLSDRDKERLADIVELQPTKNAELQERWGLESGSEVHAYLEESLGDYYFRDENSLIRATEDAASLVDVKPGVETGENNQLVVRLPELERQILAVMPDPDERTMSVVATLKAVRSRFGVDPSVEDIREGLKALRRKGAVEVTYRLVPTYGLSRPRDEIDVEARSEQTATAQ